MKALKKRVPSSRRRGNAAVLTAVSCTTLIGFMALSVDVGMLYNTRAELQRTADSAAMAAAWKLLDKDKLSGTPDMTAEIYSAKAEASAYAAMNKVLNAAPLVDQNYGNATDGDVLAGYLYDPNDQSEPISTSDPDLFNTIQVRVHRDSVRNGPVGLFFARIFGKQEVGVSASAAAVLKDGVVGWRVSPKTGNAGVLPLALHVNTWNALLAGTKTSGDKYTYDEEAGTLSLGGDGVNELNLYPGAGADQLPPGNFGTVDIGSANNSTADISRQIRYGLNEADLAYYGGEFKLGPGGTLLLEGDTGLSAAIKDDLEAIKGLPRAIPLFNHVAGPGNNAVYTIVGFAGIRIMNVKLTGAMSKKAVIIQPAHLVDDTVITGPGSGSSYFIYEPVRLVR